MNFVNIVNSKYEINFVCDGKYTIWMGDIIVLVVAVCRWPFSWWKLDQYLSDLVQTWYFSTNQPDCIFRTMWMKFGIGAYDRPKKNRISFKSLQPFFDLSCTGPSNHNRPIFKFFNFCVFHLIRMKFEG